MEIFQYTFMIKAILTGVFTAIACALLGCFLVLKRYALIGDGLAHISFGGVALGMLFKKMPFLTALVFSVICAMGIMHIKEKARLHGDTAIGVVSHLALAFGIVVASVAGGSNVDLFSYLFGNILAIHTIEMYLSIALAGGVIFTILFFYHDLFYITFNEEIARVAGIPVNKLNRFLIILTAITVLAGMRVVGLLLVASLIVLPAASSLQVSRSFKVTLIIACIFAVVSVLAGLIISFYFDVATSGVIVMVNFLIFMFALLWKKFVRQAA